MRQRDSAKPLCCKPLQYSNWIIILLGEIMEADRFLPLVQSESVLFCRIWFVHQHGQWLVLESNDNSRSICKNRICKFFIIKLQWIANVHSFITYELQKPTWKRISIFMLEILQKSAAAAWWNHNSHRPITRKWNHHFFTFNFHKLTAFDIKYANFCLIKHCLAAQTSV